MKLATSSHQKLETFFRELLNDETFRLPVIHFYVGKFTRFFTWIVKVHGITFGCRIYIMPKFLSLNENNQLTLPLKLAAHEITHALQYKREGFIKFFYKYLKSFCGNLRRKKSWDIISRQESYLEIPFEVEAREVSDKFVEWNERNKSIDSI
ncbi:MAG: hypothetical protein H0V31_06960 [Acidobacteria bacterium]|nr:hypothetical protein [Acidobacteriota bacterium]